MCCSRIRVKLNGDVKDKQSHRAGIYQKASELINKRSYWNQINGTNALWYSIIDNGWIIGSSSNLKSDISAITSAQDSACPTSENLFFYVIGEMSAHDYEEWIFAKNNSVSIQCERDLQ